MDQYASVTLALESFCDELVDRVPEQIEDLLQGEKDEIGKSDLQQDPEQFVCQYLVWPVCRALNYQHISEWYLEGYDGSPDLCIRRTSPPILGEVKRFNHHKKAIRELRNYLNHRTCETSYGISTDGLSWILFEAPMDRRKNPLVIEYISLRGAVFDYLIDEHEFRPQLEGTRVLRHSTIHPVVDVSYEEYGRLRRRDREEVAEVFSQRFAPESLDAQITTSEHDSDMSSFRRSTEHEAESRTLDDFSKESNDK